MSSAGSVSKWCSCDDPGTHNWNVWFYWYGNVGERTRNAQVLHQRIWYLLYKWGLFPLFFSFS